MENSPLEISIKDPLSQVTRGERRALLGFCALVIFVTKTGLIPSKIESLGISFEPNDQKSFLLVLGLILGYFTVAFFIYGFADYLSWKISHDEAKLITYRDFEIKMRRGVKIESEEEEMLQNWIPKWPKYATFPVSISRAFFEFLFPLLASGYAIYLLANF